MLMLAVVDIRVHHLLSLTLTMPWRGILLVCLRYLAALQLITARLKLTVNEESNDLVPTLHSYRGGNVSVESCMRDCCGPTWEFSTPPDIAVRFTGSLQREYCPLRTCASFYRLSAQYPALNGIRPSITITRLDDGDRLKINLGCFGNGYKGHATLNGTRVEAGRLEWGRASIDERHGWFNYREKIVGGTVSRWTWKGEIDCEESTPTTTIHASTTEVNPTTVSGSVSSTYSTAASPASNATTNSTSSPSASPTPTSSSPTSSTDASSATTSSSSAFNFNSSPSSNTSSSPTSTSSSPASSTETSSPSTSTSPPFNAASTTSSGSDERVDMSVRNPLQTTIIASATAGGALLIIILLIIIVVMCKGKRANSSSTKTPKNSKDVPLTVTNGDSETPSPSSPITGSRKATTRSDSGYSTVDVNSTLKKNSGLNSNVYKLKGNPEPSNIPDLYTQVDRHKEGGMPKQVADIYTEVRKPGREPAGQAGTITIPGYSGQTQNLQKRSVAPNTTELYTLVNKPTRPAEIPLVNMVENDIYNTKTKQTNVDTLSWSIGTQKYIP